jgi:hypothetical protein
VNRRSDRRVEEAIVPGVGGREPVDGAMEVERDKPKRDMFEVLRLMVGLRDGSIAAAAILVRLLSNLS